jgi:UPF0755 protein
MTETKLSKRTLLIVFSMLFTLLLISGGIGAYCLLLPNFPSRQTTCIYICPDKDFDHLCLQLQDSAACKNIHTFKQAAHLMKYPGSMKTGCYVINSGMNNLDLIRNLKRGHQYPVRITFNNIREKEGIADRLSEQLMIQADELNVLMNDASYCESLGFTPPTIKAMFIPNTYEVYWNISADNLLKRMKREYDAFWTESRKNKANRMDMSTIEVATLASIVEEESALPDEYPIIAGLYMNRLHKGMPLQADPTVKYALGNFALQRILNEHLEVESPYNTYLNNGLPPGPIRIPSIAGMDAVLNYKKHNYLYMCAKEDFSGRHNFEVTLADHNRNANRYRAALNQRKIR